MAADGMVIWGDIAYKKDLFFSPAYWRKWYKPVSALVTNRTRTACRDLSRCGNVKRVFEDFIEVGIDAYTRSNSKPDWM